MSTDHDTKEPINEYPQWEDVIVCPQCKNQDDQGHKDLQYDGDTITEKCPYCHATYKVTMCVTATYLTEWT